VEAFKAAVSAKTGMVPPPVAAAHGAVVFSDSALSSYEGTFGTLGGIATIQKKGSSLWLSLAGRKFRLTPEADSFFSPTIYAAGIIPMRPPQLKALRFTVRTIGPDRVLVVEANGWRSAMGKEYSPQPIPAAWRKRFGTWIVSNARRDEYTFFNAPLTLSERNGCLVLEGSAQGFGALHIILDPVSDVEATIVGLGRYGGETLRADQEIGGEVLEFAGYTFVRR
jgi:hypothetical protein